MVDDPYTDPATGALKNKLGVGDRAHLADLEYRYTMQRRLEMDTDPIEGPFTFDRLRETHRRLFQDIFEWAGEPRTVNIAKDTSHFLSPDRFELAAMSVFGPRGSLQRSGLLDPDVDDDTFVTGASNLLSDLNYIHPFREGNGRTQRAFLDQVAAVSGRQLSWRNVGQMDHHLASVRSFNDSDGAAFEPVIREVMKPPIDGLSRLASQSYVVTEPAPDDVLASRKRRFPELFQDYGSDRQAEQDELEF